VHKRHTIPLLRSLDPEKRLDVTDERSFRSKSPRLRNVEEAIEASFGCLALTVEVNRVLMRPAVMAAGTRGRTCAKPASSRRTHIPGFQAIILARDAAKAAWRALSPDGEA
jgi:hypothetical protein